MPETKKKTYWQELDEQRAYSFCERWELRTELQMIAMEHKHVPEPVPCACGGELQYRPTVGARQCPTCRTIMTGDGSLI